MRHPKLDTDREIEDLLRDLYGPFAKRHHARYHSPKVSYHLIIRTFQGRPLLTPNPRFRAIAAGVLARGLVVFRSIRLFAYAALSNHIHLELKGQPNEIPRFVAYIKRELTKRWRAEIGWSDTIWHRGYISTALPTTESEIRCLEYIMSQGVKEKIVSRPEHWNGLHMAHQVVGEQAVVGEWVNGTRFGKAKWKEQHKPKGRQRALDKARFTERYDLVLSPLPAWSALSEAEQRFETVALVARIVADGETARAGKPPRGMDYACGLSHGLRLPLPAPPWFEERRGFICWADQKAPETLAYIRAYWDFQCAYRVASDAYLAGARDVAFPPGAFKPVVFEPLPSEAVDVAA